MQSGVMEEERIEMQIPVNKDLDDYKEDFFKGLTLRQTVMAALTVAAGIGAFVLFYFVVRLPQTIALYLIFPFAVPVALAGFMKIDGKTPYEYLKMRLRVTSNPVYTFKPISFSVLEEQENEKAEAGQDVDPRSAFDDNGFLM